MRAHPIPRVFGRWACRPAERTALRRRWHPGEGRSCTGGPHRAPAAERRSSHQRYRSCWPRDAADLKVPRVTARYGGQGPCSPREGNLPKAVPPNCTHTYPSPRVLGRWACRPAERNALRRRWHPEEGRSCKGGPNRAPAAERRSSHQRHRSCWPRDAADLKVPRVTTRYGGQGPCSPREGNLPKAVPPNCTHTYPSPRVLGRWACRPTERNALVRSWHPGEGRGYTGGPNRAPAAERRPSHQRYRPCWPRDAADPKVPWVTTRYGGQGPCCPREGNLPKAVPPNCTHTYPSPRVLGRWACRPAERTALRRSWHPGEGRSCTGGPDSAPAAERPSLYQRYQSCWPRDAADPKVPRVTTRYGGQGPSSPREGNLPKAVPPNRTHARPSVPSGPRALDMPPRGAHRPRTQPASRGGTVGTLPRPPSTLALLISRAHAASMAQISCRDSNSPPRVTAASTWKRPRRARESGGSV